MIKKAVIPAAGFGTRFLPATKAVPKEMLTIVDIPVVQYVVEEAVSAGITDIILVISAGKRAIEEHFDTNFQLRQRLSQQGKKRELAILERLEGLADIHFVWQKEQKGLGDAIYCARHHVGGEPFAVLLGDTLIHSQMPAIKRLVDAYDKYGASAVLTEEVARERVCRYGILDVREAQDGFMKVLDLVEKPSADQAPSNYAVASRYVFTPEIFGYIEITPPGKGGEIQITDAMRLLVKDLPMYAAVLQGKRYDIGEKLGFVTANIEYALRDPEIAQQLMRYIVSIKQM